MTTPDAWSAAYETEIKHATAALLGGSVAATVTEQRARAVIAPLVQRIRQLAESRALLELMTTREAAEILGITVQQVNALCRRYELGWRIGRDTIIRPEDLAILRQRRGPGWVTGRPRTRT